MMLLLPAFAQSYQIVSRGHFCLIPGEKLSKLHIWQLEQGKISRKFGIFTRQSARAAMDRKGRGRLALAHLGDCLAEPGMISGASATALRSAGPIRTLGNSVILCEQRKRR